MSKLPSRVNLTFNVRTEPGPGKSYEQMAENEGLFPMKALRPFPSFRLKEVSSESQNRFCCKQPRDYSYHSTRAQRSEQPAFPSQVQRDLPGLPQASQKPRRCGGKSQPCQLSWEVVTGHLHILPCEEAVDVCRKTKILDIFLPKNSNTFSTVRGTGCRSRSAMHFQTGL